MATWAGKAPFAAASVLLLDQYQLIAEKTIRNTSAAIRAAPIALSAILSNTDLAVGAGIHWPW